MGRSSSAREEKGDDRETVRGPAILWTSSISTGRQAYSEIGDVHMLTLVHTLTSLSCEALSSRSNCRSVL